MVFTPKDIQQIRADLGVGIMDAKRALEKAGGDIAKAQDFLRAQGARKAEEKMSRAIKDGCIGFYVHSNNKEAGLVALSCETDFVARTDAFKDLAHDLAMHVVAMKPAYIRPEEVPTEVLSHEEAIWKEQLAKDKKPQAIIENIFKGKREKFFADVCFIKQKFVKDDAKTIEQLIQEAVTKLGENIQITGMTRLQI